MKYAAAMRYGGELVGAEDVGIDYQSYKHLGLLCPECKEPVFLRAEGTRTVKDKEIKIGAHFCHFKTKDAELAKICENRVGGYTKEDIERRSVVSRGQRLKLLQKWIEHIVYKHRPWMKNSKISVNGREFQDDKILLFDPENYLVWVDNVASSFFIDFSGWLKTEYLKCVVMEMIERETDILVTLNLDGDSYIGQGKTMSIDKSVTKAIKTSFEKSAIDSRLHLQICNEVIDFLIGENGGKKFLDKMTRASLLSIANDQWITSLNTLGISFYRQVLGDRLGIYFPEKNSIEIGLAVAQLTALNIMAIPWAEEFERLENESSPDSQLNIPQPDVSKSRRTRSANSGKGFAVSKSK